MEIKSTGANLLDPPYLNGQDSPKTRELTIPSISVIIFIIRNEEGDR